MVGTANGLQPRLIRPAPSSNAAREQPIIAPRVTQTAESRSRPRIGVCARAAADEEGPNAAPNRLAPPVRLPAIDGRFSPLATVVIGGTLRRKYRTGASVGNAISGNLAPARIRH